MKWGFFSVLLLRPFVVVMLVGPADASWPLTPASWYPQSSAAGNRIFPSLVLSILSLWDHGSQDIPLSEIDKQGLGDPLLLIRFIHPQLIDYNHQVTLALTLMLVVEMKVSKLWPLTDVCVSMCICVCVCVYMCVCVCKITLAAHHQLSPAVPVSLPAPPLNKYSIDVSEMLIWFD